jgi:antitoxin FitA
MATLTIRNLDDNIKSRLRIHAAKNGRSMEEEVRIVLERNFSVEDSGRDGPVHWVDRVVSRFQAIGGVELELPERGPPREPPTFEE